MNSGQHYRRDG